MPQSRQLQNTVISMDHGAGIDRLGTIAHQGAQKASARRGEHAFFSWNSFGKTAKHFKIRDSRRRARARSANDAVACQHCCISIQKCMQGIPIACDKSVRSRIATDRKHLAVACVSYRLRCGALSTALCTWLWLHGEGGTATITVQTEPLRTMRDQENRSRFAPDACSN